MELRESILAIVKSGMKDVRSLVCEVISVNKANYQCNLKPVDGSAEIKKARLSATEAVNNTIVIIPKQGSLVIATMLDANDAFVSMTDEAEEIEILPHGKLTIKNDQVSLKEIMNELISELKLAIIQTPAGAGNFSPTTTAKLDVIDNKINQLFKE